MLRRASLLLLLPCILAQSTTTATLSATSGTEAPASQTTSASTTAEDPAASTFAGTYETTTRSTIPISSYTFTPWPTPSQGPVPGVYPDTDPLNPPPPGSDAVPYFGRAWGEAREKAENKIKEFTLEEKVKVATGVGWLVGRCVGNIASIRDWPGLCLEDSPAGVRFVDYVTAFPAAINSAATFNRKLMRLRGLYMGLEFKGKGINVALGPMMNMGRVAAGGRNWEGFGADPYLTGEGTYETILGMQEGGVTACAKHFVGNEQEHDRMTSSSEIDDRTMHEVYAHPFLRAVMAGVGSIMCSYNLVNGTYACEDDKVLNDILKREYGFQGYVMSDWGATMSTISAITGLDMTMPGDIIFGSGDSYFGGNLVAYVRNGTIPESRVDDMASRILAAYYLLRQEQDNFPAVNFDAFHPDSDVNEHIDVQDIGGDHGKLVRELGAASVVLLKNERGLLPLGKGKGKIRSLLLVGSDSGPGRIAPNGFADQGGVDGVLAMGWGSGTVNFTYLISPLEAIQQRARKDRTSISWILDDFDLPRAGNLARFKDAVIVFLQSDSGEQYIQPYGNAGDRNNLTAWHNGDDLVHAVAAQNENTIVVTHSVGPLILEPWIDHPNVTAVLWAGLPGQEAGNSLVDVLYGDYNPSGRLPYTIAKKPEDYPAQITPGPGPWVILRIPYTEGLNIDYRHFDAKNITPRYEFGFGLSYTTFKYSNLHIDKVDEPDHTQCDLEDNWAAGEHSPIEPGSSSALWLHRPAYKVTFEIENTGDVCGIEIPQVYVNHPASVGEPPSILKGFTDVDLQPGEKKSVTIPLSRYDLSYWDIVGQGWKKPPGKIGITVGASSRDGRLHGTIP